jgi:hypothetical protein
MTSSPITRRYATLLALSVLAVAAPDTAALAGPSTPKQDRASQDLRSPDARDAAIGYEPVAGAVPGRSGPREGFDWVSAAIAAAAVGGLVLLFIGFMSGRGVHGVGRISRRGGLHT